MKEYKIAKGWALFIYVAGSLMIALFTFLPIYGLLKSDDDMVLFFGIAAIPMIILMTIAIFDAAKSKIIITNTSIGKRSLFTNRDLPLSEVSGFRTDDKYTYIETKSKAYKRIRFGQYFENKQEIFEWLYSNFQDLNEVNKEKETQEILSNDEYGRTVEEREEKLGVAKNVALGFNVFGGGVGAYTLFITAPYELSIILSIITPILAILVLPFFKGLIRLNENKESAYPSIMVAIVLPSIGLLVRAVFDFNIYDYSNLWGPLLVLLLILIGGAVAVAHKEFDLKTAKGIGALFGISTILLLYSGGVIITTNCVYDESEPVAYRAEIIQKMKHTGKTTTYKFELTPWGDQIEPETVTVSEDFYDQMEAGNTVNVYYLKGYLDIPWVIVTE
ncbi:hypothetical protein [Flammeovirga sp. SJP92]|uniref:hypothetical protein n=1 Tax=Flammeovirga sp. SJP92 TaxID=1775430 RepID=UPI0007877E32|nr:hypothetical protein [Flammeovirga sp. SJP92]KXX67142.1 hypothetical protein AVL50_27530 [Flammeovirga sp. SJP92]